MDQTSAPTLIPSIWAACSSSAFSAGKNQTHQLGTARHARGTHTITRLRKLSISRSTLHGDERQAYAHQLLQNLDSLLTRLVHCPPRLLTNDQSPALRGEELLTLLHRRRKRRRVPPHHEMAHRGRRPH